MGNCCGITVDISLSHLKQSKVTAAQETATQEAATQETAAQGSLPPTQPDTESPGGSYHARPPPALPSRPHRKSMNSRDSALRDRFRSAPQQDQRNRDWSGVSLSGQRPKARSEATPGKGNRSDRRSRSPEHLNEGPSQGQLTSTVEQILSNHLKFRILVVGKRGSGKTSLINAVFNVDTSATPENVPGKPDINFEVIPQDNQHLIVHESPAFEHGDFSSFQAIRDFISYRTDSDRPALERLHAVWICVPACDAIKGSIGEGIDKILEMNRVPVIIVFTKFDLVISSIVLESKGESSQQEERASIRAYTQCERACHSLFLREPKDVPAEIVSVELQFSYLVRKLIITTDGLIMDSRTTSTPARSRVQWESSRITPIPLVWSAASRVSPDIIIQASIEVGQSRYWRGLLSSPNFAGRPLKDCVDIIHIDIVEIWNLNDKASYLSSIRFKKEMSHVVKDLAGSTKGVSLGSDPIGSEDELAEWVDNIYHDSQEDVRWVMGYIVDLTVILDQIFRSTAGDVSVHDALSAMDRHTISGCRDRIHRDIRDIVTKAFTIRTMVPRQDVVLEQIINLIRQYCVPLT